MNNVETLRNKVVSHADIRDTIRQRVVGANEDRGVKFTTKATQVLEIGEGTAVVEEGNR